jgi:hypothetical protein
LNFSGIQFREVHQILGSESVHCPVNPSGQRHGRPAKTNFLISHPFDPFGDFVFHKAQFPMAGFFYQEENPNFLPPVILLKSIFYADQKPQSIGFQVFLPFG